jgi:galactoside O-acetyltransferase
MPFLTDQQLQSMGFRGLGSHVQISDKAAIYGAERIELGDHSRIDDFCLLSAGGGGIKIGRYVHIACYSSLVGAATIEMEDFSGLSSRVAIYSSSDDYSGKCLTNPTVPEQYKEVDSRPVILRKHVIVGAGAIILPGVEIGEGAAVGALSLVNRSCEPFGIYSGVPARFTKERSRALLDLEAQLWSETGQEPS